MSDERHDGALVADGLLRRNVLLNLAGWLLPAALAVVSIPLLAKGLGPARFGLITLAWATVGLFSFFDLGLGRALTRLVAARLLRRDLEHIPALVWTATWQILGGTGALAVLGVLAAPLIVDHGLHEVPPELRIDAIRVVRLLALGIPGMVHGVVLRGVLEAGQRFGVINKLRVPLGLATYGGPLLTLLLHGGATGAVFVIVLARTIYWLAHVPALERIMPGLSRPHPFDRAASQEIWRTGGWISVSAIASPIIVQADRLAIAATLPLAASGPYGTAAEVATKLWLFTAALQPVLFAAVSATVAHDEARAAQLLGRAARVTLLALFPAALVLIVGAQPLLAWWMRSAFSPDAVAVVRWLALGVFVNAVAQVPFAALQASEHARYPATLHLIELPIYLALLPWAAHRGGVEGVAMACAARMALDGLAMWIGAARKLPPAADAAARVLRLGIALVGALTLATIMAGRWR